MASIPGWFSFEAFTDDGDPLVSGRLYTYIQGTTTHKNAFVDAAGLIPHGYTSDGAGGLYIGLNARGELSAPLYLATGAYDITLRRADGSTVWTRRADPVQDVAATLDTALRADLASTSDAAKGDALIGVKSALAGAVARTMHDRNGDWISVKDFTGVVGDGDNDDTSGLRLAHLVAKRLYYPAGHYKITGSITLYVQDVIGDDKETTFIEPDGNFPAFINSELEFISGKLQNFFIDYGETAPTVVGTDGLKVGVKFAGASKWPTFYEIADVTVRGGWYAYYDDTGTYGSALKRVFAWNCFGGFRKQNGTTIHFEHCITQGCNNPFFIKDVLAPTFTACASDTAVSTAGNYPNTFSGCMGLVINGWDCEGNDIVGDLSSLFFFELCTGEFNGFVGFDNELTAEGALELVSLFRVDNSQMSFGGIRTKFNGAALSFNGIGTVHTLLAVNNSKVFVHGSNMDAASGGSPADRFAMAGTGGGEVKYTSTTVSGDLVGTSELADTQTGTWTPVPTSLTTTGAPTYSGKFSRTSKTVYASLQISANGGTTASTANTTKFTGLPYNPDASAVCVVSSSAVASYGNGLFNVAGDLYTPTWAATGNDVTINVTYKIA